MAIAKNEDSLCVKVEYLEKIPNEYAEILSCTKGL